MSQVEQPDEQQLASDVPHNEADEVADAQKEEEQSTAATQGAGEEKQDDEEQAAAPAKKRKRVRGPPPPPLGVVLAEERCGGDASLLRDKMLVFTAADEARAKHTEFVESLTLERDPKLFDEITLGDVLETVPALKTHKRRFEKLYTLDQDIAALYQDAQEAYALLEKKARSCKFDHYGKMLRKASREQRAKEAAAENEEAESTQERDETAEAE